MGRRPKIGLVSHGVSSTGVEKTTSSEELFKRYKANSKSINLGGKQYFVREGDLLLTEDELEEYAAEQALREVQNASTSAELSGSPEGLVGIKVDKKIVRWQHELTLSYAILRKSFAQSAFYDIAVECMSKATADWEQTCDVSFRHANELDDLAIDDPQLNSVIFRVQQLLEGQDPHLIALAFFPNDPPDERVLYLNDPFFSATLGYDKVGVTRHELGHVLGFRHEHIRSGAPPACPYEDPSDTIELTDYDPKSVMHYFCGGVGSRNMAITALDRQGAQTVYGKPKSHYHFCP